MSWAVPWIRQTVWISGEQFGQLWELENDVNDVAGLFRTENQTENDVLTATELEIDVLDTLDWNPDLKRRR